MPRRTKRISSSRSHGSRPCQPAVEQLESRLLLSAVTLMEDGILDITGTPSNDRVEVRVLAEEPDVAPERVQVIRNGKSWTFDREPVYRVHFTGDNGNDYFRNWTSIGCTVSGGPGRDVLIGGGGYDVLRGNGGADTLKGGGAADKMYGGGSADYLRGGSGNDYLSGGNGNDRLYGAAGNDQLYGKNHDDILKGGTGNDTLEGGNGGDKLYGQDGDDRMIGNGGADRLEGGSGDDWMRGKGGKDKLYGQNGDDRLFGDAGADRLKGGDGRDRLWGSSGDDQLFGQADDDQIKAGGGNDWVYGGAGNDRLWGQNGTNLVGGGPGDDHLYGGKAMDALVGGEGDDTLVSLDNSTTDRLWGQGGLDSFWVDADFWTGRRDAIEDADVIEKDTNVHAIRYFENWADRTLDGDSIPDPRSAAPDYQTFRNNPLFSPHGPRDFDLDQGSLGDCWLLAALGAVAKTNQNAVRQIVVSLGDGTYAVRLGGDKYYRVDADLPVDLLGNLVYADFGSHESIWVPIVEKAYAFHREPKTPLGKGHYGELAGKRGEDALLELNAWGTGRESFDSTQPGMSGQDIIDAVRARSQPGVAVTILFGSIPTWVGNHEYTVLGATPDYVLLRNPHGLDQDETPVRALYAADLNNVSGNFSWGNVMSRIVPIV